MLVAKQVGRMKQGALEPLNDMAVAGALFVLSDGL